jgi:hypothetical protein
LLFYCNLGQIESFFLFTEHYTQWSKEDFTTFKEPKPPRLMKNFLQAIKSVSEGSSKIITWSLSVLGGSILIIIGDSYIHPVTTPYKFIYLLFPIAWILLAISINSGINISRRSMAADFYSDNNEMLERIFIESNTDLKRQLDYFKSSLIIFSLWLLCFLLWWLFLMKLPANASVAILFLGCDCTKLPFKKECLKYCIELILRNATPEEKQLILGFSKQLASSIYRAYNTRNIQEFEDLERELNSLEIQEIISRFSSLNQTQLNYFNKSKTEREQIISAIKKLNL